MRAKVLIAGFAIAFSGLANASMTDVLTVNLVGPGGHSFRDYGYTNTIHAGARAVAEIQKTIVDPNKYEIYGFNGGVSVNAIAGDAQFKVLLKANDKSELNTLKQQVISAVQKGVKAENDFRGVKTGSLTPDGASAEIQCTIE